LKSRALSQILAKQNELGLPDTNEEWQIGKIASAVKQAIELLDSIGVAQYHENMRK